MSVSHGGVTVRVRSQPRSALARVTRADSDREPRSASRTPGRARTAVSEPGVHVEQAPHRREAEVATGGRRPAGGRRRQVSPAAGGGVVDVQVVEVACPAAFSGSRRGTPPPPPSGGQISQQRVWNPSSPTHARAKSRGQTCPPRRRVELFKWPRRAL